MDGSTISNGFVRVDALVGLLAIKEVGDELDNAGDTSRTTDKYNLVDIGFIDFRITENLLNGFKRATEEILAEFLETSTSKGGVEINTLIERVNFD